MASGARIAGVDYYLPEAVLDNEMLAAEFPEWSVDKIASKTGIRRRHIAGPDEFSSDLAIGAARALFASHDVDLATIDYLIVCTQSPDYYMPPVSALVQAALGIPLSAGATDITLGCSGYVYALGLAKGLIESGQATRVLVLTADTYSKFINPRDKSVRTIFGDGASASLVTGDGEPGTMRGFTYGTNGGGGKHLVVPSGGLRSGETISPKSSVAERGLDASGYDLWMDGPEIFNFTLDVVPSSVDEILSRAGTTRDEIDLFVFHQANAFMLDHLRKKLGVPEDKFFVALSDFGNTVSSTIPIALTEAVRSRALQPGMRVMLLGFGVGLSWGGFVTTW